jgi:hypothetical protein
LVKDVNVLTQDDPTFDAQSTCSFKTLFKQIVLLIVYPVSTGVLSPTSIPAKAGIHNNISIHFGEGHRLQPEAGGRSEA